MNTRLESAALIDFTGGLHVARAALSLGNSDMPSVLNMAIDRTGSVATRLGWNRWNDADICPVADWDPKGGFFHELSNGTCQAYIANKGTVWAAGENGTFVDLAIPCAASPHLADFAAWGDDTYIACGPNLNGKKRHAGDPPPGGVTNLLPAHVGFNDDYTIPIGGRMPQASCVEAHAGYLFCANTTESTPHPSRVRWSHPDKPEDWATEDFIDILQGGSSILALLSYRDHLLIFKSDGIWALYGFDADTWQLAPVSRKVGSISPMSVTTSDSEVFFYTAADAGGVYVYTGSKPEKVSFKIEQIFNQIQDPTEVRLAWADTRLWVTVPVGLDQQPDNSNTLFGFDPNVGDGAWFAYRAAEGGIAFVLASGQDRPFAVLQGDSGHAVVMEAAASPLASDRIGLDPSPRIPFKAHVRTSWISAGDYTMRKSWRRPRFILNQPSQPLNLRVDAYHDYEESRARRGDRINGLQSNDVTLWRLNGALDPGGADWGDGSKWGSGTEGAVMVRYPHGLGVSRSLQLQVSSDPSTPGVPWAVESIILMYVLRRRTT